MENEKSVSDYKNGQRQAIQPLIGQVLKKTAGKGNPVVIRRLLEELLQ